MMEFYEVGIFTMKRKEFGSLNKGVYERRVRGHQNFKRILWKYPSGTNTESCWYCVCFISERG